MSELRHDQNAPITEAINDRRVEPVSRLCADDLETFPGEIAYRSVPRKRSYVVRVACVEVRKGEPRPFSLNDLTEG
jgi:hypothetical protein